MSAAVNAGCMQIEHGVGIDDSALKLMAERGVYFDPHVGVVMQNYLRNRFRFLGVADYTEEGFASMEQAMRLNAAMIRKAVATPGLKLVMGSDAVAGAHGRNADELVERVRQGRTEADGCDHLGDVARRRIAEPGQDDRKTCAGVPSRHHRGRWRPHDRYHGAHACCLCDAGRKGLQTVTTDLMIWRSIDSKI